MSQRLWERTARLERLLQDQEHKPTIVIAPWVRELMADRPDDAEPARADDATEGTGPNGPA